MRAATVLALLLVAAAAARADDKAPCPLTAAIAAAVETSPVVAAAHAGLDEFEARLTTASLGWLPKFTLEGYASATPHKYGNAIEGGTAYDEWGPYLSIEVGAALPVYTFGKLSSLREMAAAGIDVGKAQVEIAQRQVELLVVQAYLTLRFTARMQNILEEGEKYLARARKYLEKLRDEDSREFDDTDMARLVVYESEVGGRRLDMERGRDMALATLSLLTGLGPEQFSPPGKLERFAFEPSDVETYIQMACQSRGEAKAMDAALVAQDALVDLEWGRLLPDFYLGAWYEISHAWAVEQQPSPFAYDPYNSWYFVAGLGMKLSFDPGERIGRLDETRAAARKLQAQKQVLLRKIELEVRDAYSLVSQLAQKIELDRKAFKAARGWIIAKVDLYESGFAELKDLTDALSEFFKRKIAYEQSIMEYDIAVAKLAAACGRSVTSFVTLDE